MDLELKLNRNITDAHARKALVDELLKNTPPEKLTTFFLQQLADYLTETVDMKKNKAVLTKNRMITVDKRETSFQGFSENLQNPESGIYNFIADSDKNVLLTPKIEITEQDLNDIPELQELRKSIQQTQRMRQSAGGQKKALLTKQLIQMRKDQYVIKNSAKPPVLVTKITKNFNKKINLDEKITIDENGQPVSDGIISFFNPTHISQLLINYSNIKKEIAGHIESDFYYLIKDFEKLLIKALKGEYAIFLDIVKLKFKDKTSKEIVAAIKEKYKYTYSTEYISILWRKKIPKILSEQAKQDWILWHYTFEEKGKWKKCSRCQQVKLAHPYFFTKNKTSKDGWYSICKCCRNEKNNK